jgi:histidinol-phosphate phosphatase family protein
MNLRHLGIDSTWALFLDRDGVINRRIVGGYVRSRDEFEFLPGITEAIRTLAGIFGKIIVVSNQQGVGKGLMTGEDVDAVHERMIKEITGSGGRIDAVFYSPHLHSDRSPMRKPGVGMALAARRRYPEISFKRSLMAGDSLSDMIFGKRLGMKTALISPDPTPARTNPRQIDFIFSDLLSLAHAL